MCRIAVEIIIMRNIKFEKSTLKDLSPEKKFTN